MKKFSSFKQFMLRSIVLLMLVFTGIALKAQTTYYVDVTRSDNSGDGKSWANAKKDIQVAMNLAVSGDAVWVKGGTYYPTMDPFANASPTDPRDKTIYLTNGVALYGSFAGTETTLAQRTASVRAANTTTISGDIGTVSDNTDNCYHVVLSVSGTTTTILDGFTITAGNANGSGSITVASKTIQRTRGAGMCNSFANPTITNLSLIHI